MVVPELAFSIAEFSPGLRTLSLPFSLSDLVGKSSPLLLIPGHFTPLVSLHLAHSPGNSFPPKPPSITQFKARHLFLSRRLLHFTHPVSKN